MEELKRPNCAPEKKQVVVNISTHGGGGFGGLILLGGALATAAFGSAFIIGKKRRGGSRDNGHIPPPPAAVNDKDERNIEANKKDFTFLDAYKHSSETTKEIELKNDSQSLILYEKGRIEINGVAVSDSDSSEQTLCYLTPKTPENGAISNGGVSHLPVWEQKTLLPLEIENEMVCDVKIQSPAIDEHGVTHERNGFEKVKEGESRDDGATESMGEIHEVKCEDTEESKGNHVPEIGLKCNEEGTFVSELHGKDGKENILPAFGSPISEHENVYGDQKQGLLSDGMVEIIHEYQAIEGDKKDQVEHIEENSVKDHEESDELDEEIIIREGEEENDDQQNNEEKGYIDNSAPGNRQPGDSEKEDVQIHKGEKENDDQQSEVNNEEKGHIENSTPENRPLGDSGEEDVQSLAMHLPEEEQIFPEGIEVSEDDAVNEEIEVSFCQQEDTEDEVEKNIENEVEESSETIDTVIASANDEEDIIDGTEGDEDLSDEVEQNTEETVDSSMESNSEGVWPAEAIQEPSIETQQLKLVVNQEIEGKIQEDTIVKRGKHGLHPYKIIPDRNQITNRNCNLAKRYVMDLATLKDYSTTLGIRRVLLVAIPVLSSVSCSWLFGLSFDKLCFIVLLTIVLSKSLIVI